MVSQQRSSAQGLRHAQEFRIAERLHGKSYEHDCGPVCRFGVGARAELVSAKSIIAAPVVCEKDWMSSFRT